MSFVPGLVIGPRTANERIAERVDRAPEVRELEAQDDVGVRDERAAAVAVVQRVARREIHPAALIDDRRLQRFGKLDEEFHAGRRARRAIGDDHRILGAGQETGSLGHGGRITLRRSGQRQPRDAQPPLDLRAKSDPPAARHR